MKKIFEYYSQDKSIDKWVEELDKKLSHLKVSRDHVNKVIDLMNTLSLSIKAEA